METCSQWFVFYKCIHRHIHKDNRKIVEGMAKLDFLTTVICLRSHAAK